jgi:hypothetical protein
MKDSRNIGKNPKVDEYLMKVKKEEHEAMSLETNVETKPQKTEVLKKIRAVIKIYKENVELYEIYKTYTGKKDTEILTKIINDALKGKNVRKEIYEMIRKIKSEIDKIEEKMRKEFT